ncbi:MAG: hypothetical protein ACHQD7_05125 [Chitinophagales bacterium]
MTNPGKYKEALRKLPLDIRLEVILADLIAENGSMEDLLLVNNSLFKRNYHYDIENTSEVEFGITRKNKLCFTINREGLYDQLPEDLFHQAGTIKSNAGKEEAIQEIRAQQEIEKQSRLFFLPFEHEFYRQRVKLEVEERNFLFETNTVLPGGIFDYLWDLPAFLDDLQKSKLGILIPVLNKIAGKTDLIAYIMESITGDEVSIQKAPPAKFTIPDQPQLGDMQLGLTSILGGEVSGWQSGFSLVIFVSAAGSFSDYMPGGKKLAVHEFLCNLLMPLDTDLFFESDYSKVSNSFIAENDNSCLGRLNYTTVI